MSLWVLASSSLLTLAYGAERPLTSSEMAGVRVWNQMRSGVRPAPDKRSVTFFSDAQFKNETRFELASVSVRMTVELSGKRAYVSPPQDIRNFKNLSVSVDGALQPFNKTEFVRHIGFPIKPSLWRTDSDYSLRVVGATTFVNPDLHDAGHLYTRLMNGKDEEEIEMLKRHPDLLKVKNAKGFDVTLMAFATCGPKMIRYVLAHGGSAKAHTVNGGTIMHMAALNGFPGVQDLALKLGGDVNAKTKHGKTPLLKAIVHGQPVTWRWLLDHGANPRYEVDPGHTAAQYAISEGQALALTDLAKAGLSPRTKDSLGQGWMHYAVFNYLMFDAVRRFGVPVDDVNPKTGETPLMTASWSGYTEPQVWLLQHGADPDRKDKRGRTALDYAGTYNYDRIMAAYRRSGRTPTPAYRKLLEQNRKFAKNYFASLVKRYAVKR